MSTTSKKTDNVSLASPAAPPQDDRWQPPAPDDWEEFVIAAFNEGWAAKESNEFLHLKHAYDESHVKLQIELIYERSKVPPAPEPPR